jgi:hypothetical protein
MNLILITIFVFSSNDFNEYLLKNKTIEIKKSCFGLSCFKKKNFKSRNDNSCLKIDHLKNKFSNGIEHGLMVESSTSQRICMRMIRQKKIENLIESLYEIDFNTFSIKNNSSEKERFNYTQSMLSNFLKIDFTQKYFKNIDFSIVTNESNENVLNFIYNITEFLYMYKFDYFKNYFEERNQKKCCKNHEITSTTLNITKKTIEKNIKLLDKDKIEQVKLNSTHLGLDKVKSSNSEHVKINSTRVKSNSTIKQIIFKSIFIGQDANKSSNELVNSTFTKEEKFNPKYTDQSENDSEIIEIEVIFLLIVLLVLILLIIGFFFYFYKTFKN